MHAKHLLAALAFLSATVVSAEDAPAGVESSRILTESDRARGGGVPGVVWTVRIAPSQSSEPDRLLEVTANGTASLAETLEPSRFKGSKLLQVDRSMWMSRPGLRKPVPISPRQKLTGQAAQGDIASTNYAVDYQAKWLRDEKVGDEEAYVLELTARNRFCTYDRIVYWVAKSRAVGIKAEFYSVSGKLLKSASFTYGNTIEYKGKNYPFVSKMIILDALTNANTTLLYSGVRVTKLASSVFDVNRLSE